MSEPMEMNCTELARVAAELALGVLTGRERADAVAHLSGCDACRENVRQMIETHEGLVALLPPAEPSAGFEMRVLDRLGMAAGPHRTGASVPAETGPRGSGPRDSGPWDSGPRDFGPRDLGPGETRARGTEPQRPAPRRPAGLLAPPGRRAAGRRRSGARRSRRLLAAGALVLAIAGAGLGGWGLGMGTAARPGLPPSESQQVPLAQAAFLTPSHQNVGQLFYYRESPRWVYMSVELPAGNGMVTCQLMKADGTVVTVGSFRLADGYGAWGSPDPGTLGPVRGARLVAPDGTILATATF